jgi:hypothetical protein
MHLCLDIDEEDVDLIVICIPFCVGWAGDVSRLKRGDLGHALEYTLGMVSG